MTSWYKLQATGTWGVDTAGRPEYHKAGFSVAAFSLKQTSLEGGKFEKNTFKSFQLWRKTRMQAQL